MGGNARKEAAEKDRRRRRRRRKKGPERRNEVRKCRSGERKNRLLNY